MAFGDRAKEMATNKRTDGEGAEFKAFVSPHMPIGSGRRLFRILPELENGKAKLTPRLSPNGNQVKKSGKVLVGMEPTSETAALIAWWEVNVGGTMSPRRLVFDMERRFKNPLWKYVEANFAKDTKERKVFKNIFAINVLDLSPVKENAQGQLFYQSESGKFDLLAQGPNGKLITDKDLLPGDDVESHPLRQVRILEGSYGAVPGKNLFAQLAELAQSIENDEGLVLRLPEFTIQLKTTGQKLDTVRTMLPSGDYKPLGDDIIALPRYDLETWLKPWDEDAIQELIDGEDFNNIVENYNIKLYPEIVGATAPSSDEALFED